MGTALHHRFEEPEDRGLLFGRIDIRRASRPSQGRPGIEPGGHARLFRGRGTSVRLESSRGSEGSTTRTTGRMSAPRSPGRGTPGRGSASLPGSWTCAGSAWTLTAERPSRTRSRGRRGNTRTRQPAFRRGHLPFVRSPALRGNRRAEREVPVLRDEQRRGADRQLLREQGRLLHGGDFRDGLRPRRPGRQGNPADIVAPWNVQRVPHSEALSGVETLVVDSVPDAGKASVSVSGRKVVFLESASLSNLVFRLRLSRLRPGRCAEYGNCRERSHRGRQGFGRLFGPIGRQGAPVRQGRRRERLRKVRERRLSSRTEATGRKSSRSP